MKSKRVLVYRREIGRPNETFIRSQADMLPSYDCHYIANAAVKGVHPDHNYTLIDNEYRADSRATHMQERKREIAFFSRHNRLWKSIAGQLHPIDPRIIHAHGGEEGVLIYNVAEQLKIPLLVTCHGHDVTFPNRLLDTYYNIYREKMYKSSSAFIAVSQFVKEKMIEKGYPEHKIMVHYTGVDTDYFTPDRLGTSIRKPIVLFVGRLDAIKGLSYLIQAQSIVQQYLPGVHLVVIGDGQLRAKLERFASRRLRHYTFLGNQPPAIVKQWLNEASVFAAPSIRMATGFEEALGTVFVEACSMGTPTACFGTGGVPEVIVHNKTGLLAGNKNVEELAANIMRLLRDRLLWAEISRNAMCHARDNFNIVKQNKRLENIYDALVEQYGRKKV